jgi:hypothetical protein
MGPATQLSTHTDREWSIGTFLVSRLLAEDFHRVDVALSGVGVHKGLSVYYLRMFLLSIPRVFVCIPPINSKHVICSAILDPGVSFHTTGVICSDVGQLYAHPRKFCEVPISCLSSCPIPGRSLCVSSHHSIIIS